MLGGDYSAIVRNETIQGRRDRYAADRAKQAAEDSAQRKEQFAIWHGRHPGKEYWSRPTYDLDGNRAGSTHPHDEEEFERLRQSREEDMRREFSTHVPGEFWPNKPEYDRDWHIVGHGPASDPNPDPEPAAPLPPPELTGKLGRTHLPQVLQLIHDVVLS